MYPIGGLPDIRRVAQQRGVILYQNTVVKCCDACRRFEDSFFTEFWPCPDYIVVLPFAWFFAGICKWNGLFVHSPCLAVNISRVFIIVQYLYFISTCTPWKRCKEDTTVASPLT